MNLITTTYELLNSTFFTEIKKLAIYSIMAGGVLCVVGAGLVVLLLWCVVPTDRAGSSSYYPTMQLYIISSCGGHA
jgi:hypothetical protein